jgi:hypothetical protein
MIKNTTLANPQIEKPIIKFFSPVSHFLKLVKNYINIIIEKTI